MPSLENWDGGFKKILLWSTIKLPTCVHIHVHKYNTSKYMYTHTNHTLLS